MKREDEMKRMSKRFAMTRVAITTLVLFILTAPGYVHSSPADDMIPCFAASPSASPYEIDFSKKTNGDPLLPEITPEGADRRFQDRANVVTYYNACRGDAELVDKDGKVKFVDDDGDVNLTLDFTTIAIAKLEAGGKCECQGKENIAQVNEALLKARVKHKSGTDSDFPCKRSGNYDFALRGLVTIMYRYGPHRYGPKGQEQEGQNKLSPNVYAHVLHNLLNQRGPHDPDIEKVCFGVTCPVDCVPESENHILLIETSRYLTNQLLLKEGYDPKYDNAKNGFNEWMLRHLQQFLQNDFDEYNSRPYQTYSTLPIQNLYDFAEDPNVKMAAQMVLDYISAKFAVSSNRLRRAVPFRRLKENKDRSHLFDNNSDPQTQRFIILSGLTQLLAEVKQSNGTPAPYHANYGGRDIMQLAAVGTYRVPPMILDLVMNKLHKSYYQFIKHDGVEIYSSSPEFLITAGGFWNPSRHGFDEFFCYADAGWALPTTLMPSDAGMDYKDVDYNDFIRIDGDRTRSCTNPSCNCHREDNERRNTCVAPGFACGLNPIIPQWYFSTAGIGSSCFREKGPWMFIDATGRCSRRLDYGIYVVVYSKPVAPGGPPGWTVGFFEAASANAAPSFQSFIDGVLSRNSSLDLKQFEVNEYVTVTGRRIRFIPDVPGGNKYNWGIVSVGGSPFDGKDRDIAKWPLAEGDIINSDGHSGYLTIDNPFLNRRLILDMRDPLRPNRTEINGVGPSDKVVWVDFNYRGTNEYGTFELPYKTLAEGVRAIPWNGGTLKIKAGSTKEVITILNRMRIEASGGTVTIGR